jgi:hypothetical protein
MNRSGHAGTGHMMNSAVSCQAPQTARFLPSRSFDGKNKVNYIIAKIKFDSLSHLA